MASRMMALFTRLIVAFARFAPGRAAARGGVFRWRRLGVSSLRSPGSHEGPVVSGFEASARGDPHEAKLLEVAASHHKD